MHDGLEPRHEHTSTRRRCRSRTFVSDTDGSGAGSHGIVRSRLTIAARQAEASTAGRASATWRSNAAEDVAADRGAALASVRPFGDPGGPRPTQRDLKGALTAAVIPCG